MTSEGQHAGHRPGATSGTGADQFGPDGFPPDAFPPDSDGHRTADRAPSYPHAQESFPSAYAPPPQSTPNGGSPFVVPAVPPAGQGAGSAVPGSPAAQPPGYPPPLSQPPGYPPALSQPPGFPASGAGQPGLPQRGPQQSGFPPADMPQRGAQQPGFPAADQQRGAQQPGYPPGDQQRGSQASDSQRVSQPAAFPASDAPRGSQPPSFPPSALPQRGSQAGGSQPGGSQPGGSPAPGSPPPGFPPPTFSSRGAQPAGPESPAFPPPTFSSPGAQPPASSSSGAPSGSSQPPGFPPPSFSSPGAQPPSGSPAVGRPGPDSPPFGAQGSGPQPAGAQSAVSQSAGEQPGSRSPGPAFGPGAAKFASASSGSARVPEQGGLPQRPPAAPEPPQSAWAPPPSAQPSGAAEENPFARQAEPPHPYRSGGGDLPQRSPGIAGGPLDGPVGEFNGFTPTRQAADSAPDRRPAFEQPAAREQFGAERSSFAPAPREPGGSAAAEGFGSARTDEDRPAGDRPPGLSAFGDQRVRVPGATLTGLPDASPAAADSDGGDSGAFPARGSGDSGGFPTRGGSGNGSFPIRGAGARSDDSGAFSARDAGFAPSEDPDNDKFARRDDFGRDDDAFPSRGDGAFPGRSDANGDNNGAFSAREAIENGSLSARGDVDSDGFPGGDRPDSNPFRDGSFRRDSAGGADGGDPFGRFESDQPSDGSGGNGYAQRVPGASFAPAGSPDGASSGYPQRVPGASFGSSGSPAAAESRSAASVPQPRDPAERPESGEPGPAKGTARPVSASASVPVASRVSPPADAEELPPPPVVSPQSRVYGRPAPADDEPAEQPPFRDEDQPVGGGFGAAPTSGAYGQAAEQFPGATSQASGSPYGRPQEQFPGATSQASGSPYGRPVESMPDEADENPYARPADGTYGKPASADGTYGRPPETPFGARPSSGASPFADGPDGFDDGAGQPGRPAGRASASARVGPPAQPFAPASPAPGQAPDPGNAVQFTEFTTDIAGRGRPGQVPGNPAARTTPPDQYSENTTDVSGRGPGSDQPYVPAPALPSMHAAPPLENGFPPAQAPDSTQPFGERPRMGGVYPGAASRATVTPPGPEQTAAWPGRPEADADQSRFDSFKQDSPAIVPTEVAKPETPHVRMLPVILGVILGAALIVGLTLGVTWLIARGSDDGGSGFSVSAGDCVKRDGNEAVTANCSDPGSFEVTAIKNTKEECPDPNQPYVVNPTDNGRSQVLCLKPRT